MFFCTKCELRLYDRNSWCDFLWLTMARIIGDLLRSEYVASLIMTFIHWLDYLLSLRCLFINCRSGKCSTSQQTDPITSKCHHGSRFQGALVAND